MRLLTVGLGSLRGESAAVGVDFASRGRRADEAIDVLRLLWAGDADGVSYQGEFFSIKHLRSFPKPYQATTLPIHVGGSSRAAARRAGRRGDGYFAGGLVPPDERAAQFGVMLTIPADWPAGIGDAGWVLDVLAMVAAHPCLARPTLPIPDQLPPRPRIPTIGAIGVCSAPGPSRR